MRISIDQDKCIASGACVIAAPAVFAQDEDGLVIVLEPNPGPELQEQANEAIRACPAAVIWIEE